MGAFDGSSSAEIVDAFLSDAPNRCKKLSLALLLLIFRELSLTIRRNPLLVLAQAGSDSVRIRHLMGAPFIGVGLTGFVLLFRSLSEDRGREGQKKAQSSSNL